MRFAKMQGAGNSYAFTLEDVSEPQRLAREISAGADTDGLILIKPSESADFAMEIYNADGSRAEMCGNGIRCLGKYVYENGLTEKTGLTIETDAGERRLRLFTENGLVKLVRVNLGRPETLFSQYPMTVKGRRFYVTYVLVGNPHAVIYTEDIDSLPICELGPEIENSKIFRTRVNVEFAESLSADKIKMRVWERGSGETMACGTGSAAAAAAGFISGKCGPSVDVCQPGGTLHIDWDKNELYLTGGAELVCEGVWPDT